MTMGKSLSSRCGGARRAWRPASRLAVLAVLLSLAACNPVETWRDWTGASRNDPDPETTPNTQNLAAGEASDYPNLATVPPPPTRALTAAEREKLTQSLIADQANARHTDEQLRAGFPAVSAPPPPPPPVASASEPGNAPTGSAAGSAQPPPSAPSPGSSPEPAGGGTSVAPSPSAAAGTGPAGSGTPARPGQGLRKQGEPPEPGPMESSLEMPQARTTPTPEQIQPAPPPPQLPPTPRVANVASTPRSAPVPLTRAPLPDATGSAAFQPPPPPPELPPLPPNRSAAAESGKGGQKAPAPAVNMPVAEIRFGADSTSLTDADRQNLATVVPLYRQNPGRVRIVGYAGAGAGGGAAEQLNSFHAALDRAQAVAAALTQAGIPSDKIQVEASPAGASAGESRAEVLIEH
jgi:outer membrane protein OmpA-like peptidoglycan-associated protein